MTIEKVPSVEDRVTAILRGEVLPKNRAEKQIVLAVELYVRQTGQSADLSSKEIRDTIMFNWTDNQDNSFSKAYKDLENHPEFKTHPRLQGNILNITIDDVIYFKENRKLMS